jgi:hypothetical protein
MTGAIHLFPIYAFMTWTGTNLPFRKSGDMAQHIPCSGTGREGTIIFKPRPIKPGKTALQLDSAWLPEPIQAWWSRTEPRLSSHEYNYSAILAPTEIDEEHKIFSYSMTERAFLNNPYRWG